MTKRFQKQITTLLNECEYDRVLDLCSALSDADMYYFSALALDQKAAFQKYHKKSYKRLLKKSYFLIQKGRVLFPLDLRFIYLLGIHYLHSQQFENAKKIFSYLFIKTKDPKYLISIANVQKATGHFEAALLNYRKAGKHGFSKLLLSHNIAKVYELMGKEKQAMKHISEGLKHRPKNEFEKLIKKELGLSFNHLSQKRK